MFSVIDSIRPKSGYTVEISPEGRLVVNFINGPQITSSVINRDYFVREWFSEKQLDIFLKLEDLMQATMKESGPRIYSGLYGPSHVERGLETAFRIAKQAGVSLDDIIMYGIVGHDVIEDNREVRELQQQWGEAVIVNDPKQIASLERDLKVTRIKVKTNIEKELLRHLGNIKDIGEYERDKNSFASAFSPSS